MQEEVLQKIRKHINGRQTNALSTSSAPRNSDNGHFPHS